MSDKAPKLGLFEWINSLSHTKKLELDSYTYHTYNQFMITRAFGNFEDTILIANDMNMYPCASNEGHFQFFNNAIRKKKRWAKWPKETNNNDLEIVMEYYPKLSKEKCLGIVKIMKPEDILEMKKCLEEGGAK
ncbi:MAG: DNA polymerase clamp loader subunit A [Candidatus Izemoplasma sp.]